MQWQYTRESKPLPYVKLVMIHYLNTPVESYTVGMYKSNGWFDLTNCKYIEPDMWCILPDVPVPKFSSCLGEGGVGVGKCPSIMPATSEFDYFKHMPDGSVEGRTKEQLTKELLGVDIFNLKIKCDKLSNDITKLEKEFNKMRFKFDKT